MRKAAVDEPDLRRYNLYVNVNRQYVLSYVM